MKNVYTLLFAMTMLAGQAIAQVVPDDDQDQAINFYTIRDEAMKKWAGKEPQRGDGYKVFKRWEYFWQARILPDGSFQPPGYTQETFARYLDEHPESVMPEQNAAANWTQLGPGTSAGGYYGLGRINCIALHPTNPNTMWVGSAAGGVWKTTNGGNSWSTNTDNLLPALSLGVSAIAVDPNNPNTLYMATGDKGMGAGGGGFPYSAGIYKSTDGGNTWNTVGSFPGIGTYYLINDVVVHPVQGNLVVAATSKGLYRSADGGATWNKAIGNTENFWDIKFRPGTPQVVYAASSNGFYRSSNNGVDWDKIGSINGSARIQIAVTPANPNLVAMVSSRGDGSFGGFFVSNNSGSDWVTRYGGPKNLLVWDQTGSRQGGQGTYDLCIAIAPGNPNLMYVGGVNLWRSTDGGASWSIASYWTSSPGNNPPPGVPTVHADQHSLVWQNNNTLLLGNDGGIYRSTNGGGNWTELTNGLVISQMYRIGVSQSDARVICGLQDNSTKLRSSSGSWSEFAPTGDGMESFFHPTQTSTVYYASYYGNLSRQMNGSVNLITPPGQTDSGAWITPWLMDPNNSSTLYAGYEAVWKSTNGGNTWAQLAPISKPPGVKLEGLVVAPSNSSYLYAATRSEIWRSTNAGQSWVAITSGLPVGSGRPISYLAVDPANANRLYATFQGYSSGNKVFQTTNGGTTWTNISGSLPNLPVNCIAAQPGSGQTLYAGTDVGVFYRDANMSDWQPFNAGLPRVIVTELEIRASAGKLVAATYGRGLWESDLASGTSGSTLSIAPAAQSVGSGSGVASVDVAASGSWNLTSNASWVSLSKTSGTGNATVAATYIANLTGASREATLTLSGGGKTATAKLTQVAPGNSTCNAPSNLNSTNITTSSARLAWIAVPGALSYSVEYRVPGGNWTPTAPSSVTTTFFNLNNLSAGLAHEWRVRTNCAGSIGSAWSGVATFLTSTAPSCSEPGALSFTNVSQEGATLNWQPAQGATSYSIQYRALPNGSWISPSPSSTAFSTYSLVNLTPNTGYEWRVRSNCQFGQSSNWVVGTVFVTAAACLPPEYLSTLKITANAAAATWSPVNGADSYSIQVRVPPNGVWTNTNPFTFFETAVLIVGLQPQTTYQWRVRSNCIGGVASAWSEPSEFETWPACYGGVQYPATTLVPSTSWKFQNNIWGGEYCVMDVEWGKTYIFSYCSGDGAQLTYDGQIFLRDMGQNILAYSDDVCSLQPRLVWQSDITGQIQVLLAEYYCLINQGSFSRLAYRQGSSVNDDPVDRAFHQDGIVYGSPLPQAHASLSESVQVGGEKGLSPLSMRLFPNPATDRFMLQFIQPEGCTGLFAGVRVYALSGALVRDEPRVAVAPGENTVVIDTGGWPAGVYLVRLTGSDGQQTVGKIAVE